MKRIEQLNTMVRSTWFFVVVHLDDVHQARRPADAKLREGAARAERGEQNQRDGGMAGRQ